MASQRGRMNTRNNRSLLGLDDDSNKRLIYAEECEDVFDRETEVNIEELSGKVEMMGRVGGEIEIEIGESMKHIDDMNEGFSSVQGALDQSFKKLKELKNSANSSHIFYLVIFIILVFLFFYVVIL